MPSLLASSPSAGVASAAPAQAGRWFSCSWRPMPGASRLSWVTDGAGSRGEGEKETPLAGATRACRGRGAESSWRGAGGAASWRLDACARWAGRRCSSSSVLLRGGPMGRSAQRGGAGSPTWRHLSRRGGAGWRVEDQRCVVPWRRAVARREVWRRSGSVRLTAGQLDTAALLLSLSSSTAVRWVAWRAAPPRAASRGVVARAEEGGVRGLRASLDRGLISAK